MGRRNWWMLAVAWLLTVAPWAGAVHVIPAVDLPDAVPDTVRDRVARELASNRDRLSGVVHPFRGEFHGLGAPAGGSSAAYDLSADGRVVVGADVDNAGDSEGFVWSPWTGRTVYDMRPAGVSGGVTATTISGDGVYVGGNLAMSSGSVQAFRWSLAGVESVASRAFPSTTAITASGNGSAIVGTATAEPVWPRQTRGLLGRDPYFLGDLTDDDGDFPVVPTSQAYRYTASAGIEPFDAPSGYLDTQGVGVSGDGQTTLVNGYAQARSLGTSAIEPFLWTADGDVRSLGHPDLNPVPGALNRPPRIPFTTATAISADGSTVVGTASPSEVVLFGSPFSPRVSQAVLWHEESGWTDLGRIKSRVRLADDLNGNGSNSACSWCFLYGHGVNSTANAVSGDGSLVLGSAAVQWPFLTNIGHVFVPWSIPFLWDEQRGMRQLTDVLALDYGLSLAGWSLGEATAISDDGTTIIGNGLNPDGDSEAWRAVLDRSTPDGDLDFDGDVDHHDYQTLVGNLGLDAATDAVFYADGDLNADGLVDQTDADALLSRYENRWMGDFNADGLVDLADYTLWRDLEGLFTGGLADSNGDGWVNDADLAAWRSHFGMAVEAIRGRSVPEPTAIAGLLVGLIAAAVPQRRAGAGARGARG